MKSLIIITSFSRIIMFVMSIICLFNGISKLEKNDKIKGLVYLSAITVIDCLTYILIVLFLNNKNLFIEISDHTQYLYQFLEILIVLKFYIDNESDLVRKGWGNIKILIIAILCLVYIINIERQIIYTIIELSIINYFSIRYFHKNFYKEDIQEKQYKFVFNGLFIFTNITAPYYIIDNKLEITSPSIIYSLNFINDLGYTLLFASIYKEIKCKSKK